MLHCVTDCFFPCLRDPAPCSFQSITGYTIARSVIKRFAFGYGTDKNNAEHRKRILQKGETDSMAIYVTGDTHGINAHGPFSFDGYLRRFSTTSFPEQDEMTKEDYVIICGDFGGVWSTNRSSAEEPSSEKAGLNWLEQRPFTTLFVPGNHENYDRLTGCRNQRLMDSWFYAEMPCEEKKKLSQGYPRNVWHGGHVRTLRPSVMMLERGDIFYIDGKTCFAFGGARSHDIQDGIIDRKDYDSDTSFRNAIRLYRLTGMMFRVNHLSWWEQEMPSKDEMDFGLRTLKENDNCVDFIISHCCPQEIASFMGFYAADELTSYFDEVAHTVKFKRWYFGHYHDTRTIFYKFILLYDGIERVL